MKSLLLALIFALTLSAQAEIVSGYYRKDGTYVESYRRSRSTEDNSFERENARIQQRNERDNARANEDLKDITRRIEADTERSSQRYQDKFERDEQRFNDWWEREQDRQERRAERAQDRQASSTDDGLSPVGRMYRQQAEILERQNAERRAQVQALKSQGYPAEEVDAWTGDAQGYINAFNERKAKQEKEDAFSANFTRMNGDAIAEAKRQDESRFARASNELDRQEKLQALKAKGYPAKAVDEWTGKAEDFVADWNYKIEKEKAHAKFERDYNIGSTSE